MLCAKQEALALHKQGLIKPIYAQAKLVLKRGGVARSSGILITIG